MAIAPDKRINSIADLTRMILQDTEDYSGPIWYRGQSNYDWSLMPSFYRENYKTSEQSLLLKFRQNATMLIERPTTDSFEWMFLMQHYGVPTRLLDWTESPLVALYFCVNSNEDSDAALWVLKPSELNKHSNIDRKVEDGHLLSFQDEELKGYTIESLASSEQVRLLPLATIAIRNNSRIQAQLGTFTIHHHERIPVEEVENGSHVCKFIIKKEQKDDLRKELRLLGFSRFQLFPELSSVGESLRGELE